MKRIILGFLIFIAFSSNVFAKNDNSRKVLKKIGYTDSEIKNLSQNEIEQYSNVDLNSIKSTIKYYKTSYSGIDNEITKIEYYNTSIVQPLTTSEDNYVKIIISVNAQNGKYYPRMHVIWKNTPGKKSSDYIGLVWKGNNYSNVTVSTTDSTFLTYMDSSVRELPEYYTKLAKFNINSGLVLSVVEILTIETATNPYNLCGSYYHVDNVVDPATPYPNGIFPQTNGEFWWQNGQSFTDSIFMVRQICL
ncbi:MAG: hypothetical protein RSB77_01785 [Bacilli bacterium]